MSKRNKNTNTSSIRFKLIDDFHEIDSVIGYHGTTIEKANLIMDRGLQIGEEAIHLETHSEQEKNNDNDPPRSFKNGIFFTELLPSAIRYSDDAVRKINYGESDVYQIAIIRIESLPPNAQIGDDGYGDKMIDQSIPSIYLHFMTHKEIMVIINKDVLSYGDLEIKKWKELIEYSLEGT